MDTEKGRTASIVTISKTKYVTGLTRLISLGKDEYKLYMLKNQMKARKRKFELIYKVIPLMRDALPEQFWQFQYMFEVG